MTTRKRKKKKEKEEEKEKRERRRKRGEGRGGGGGKPAGFKVVPTSLAITTHSSPSPEKRCQKNKEMRGTLS